MVLSNISKHLICTVISINRSNHSNSFKPYRDLRLRFNSSNIPCRWDIISRLRCHRAMRLNHLSTSGSLCFIKVHRDSGSKLCNHRPKAIMVTDLTI